MSEPGKGASRDGGGHSGHEGFAPRAPLSEWIVAGVSTLLLLGMLTYTALEALHRPQGPAVVTVTTDSVIRSDGGHGVMITVRNDGGETAARVHVHGALRSGDLRIEESEVVFDYVPAGSERSGVLQFRRDPAGHELEVRVTGFGPP